MADIFGVETGKLLGFGHYSKVYENPTDDSKVYMVGRFANDTFKLTLYESIGGLFSITRQDDEYIACLEKMNDYNVAWDETQEFSSFASSLYRTVTNDRDRWHVAQDRKDYFLYEFGTHPRLSDRAAECLFSIMACNIGDYHWDNKQDNWLVDKYGNCLPMDVFNASSSPSHEAREQMESRLKPYESESQL
jgi:hypothetical protein